MEKIEIREDGVYSIQEKKLDGIDHNREIAILEKRIKEDTDKLKTFKSFKKQQDVIKKPLSRESVSTK